MNATNAADAAPFLSAPPDCSPPDPDLSPLDIPTASPATYPSPLLATFDSFIVGEANRLAYTAAREISLAPGERYNPLLLYGGPGLGKTHLLRAIGHAMRAAGRAVSYVTAEQFTNDLIQSLDPRGADAFHRRYREVDALLVDDIQFIAGKEATEEEFFHTFNALHDLNKQIVLSSDRPPSAMRLLHDRLRSRFEWGLIADIQPPDYAQRLAILRAKAASQPVPISDDALIVIAQRIESSVRTLEGALNLVVAHARLLRQPLTPALVTLALAPFTDDPSRAATRAAPNFDAVLAAVARHFAITVADLCGKSRLQAVVWARHIAMYLLREDTSATLPQIGEYLGGRDHTTIMHGYAHIAETLPRDEQARLDLAAIRAALRQPAPQRRP